MSPQSFPSQSSMNHQTGSWFITDLGRKGSNWFFLWSSSSCDSCPFLLMIQNQDVNVTNKNQGDSLLFCCFTDVCLQFSYTVISVSCNEAEWEKIVYLSLLNWLDTIILIFMWPLAFRAHDNNQCTEWLWWGSDGKAFVHASLPIWNYSNDYGSNEQ